MCVHVCIHTQAQARTHTHTQCLNLRDGQNLNKPDLSCHAQGPPFAYFRTVSTNCGVRKTPKSPDIVPLSICRPVVTTVYARRLLPAAISMSYPCWGWKAREEAAELPQGVPASPVLQDKQAVHSESFPSQGGLGGRLTEFPSQPISWVKKKKRPTWIVSVNYPLTSVSLFLRGHPTPSVHSTRIQEAHTVLGAS